MARVRMTTEEVIYFLERQNSKKNRKLLKELKEAKAARGKTKGAKHSIYGNVKPGDILIDGRKIYMRSTWERNYARYLTWLKKKGDVVSWLYEPKDRIFQFPVKQGITHYLPDFVVIWKGGKETVDEIKGYMDAKSKTKKNRMKKYFPEVDYRIIGQKEYKELQKKVGKIIKDWEF